MMNMMQMVNGGAKKMAASGAAACSAGRRSMGSQPSLSVEFQPNGRPLPKLKTLAAAGSSGAETKVTKLENGLRVASEDTHQQATSIGLFVDAGSRFEDDGNNGVSHFLEHMAFKSTEARSSLRIVRDVENLGASVGASSTREYTVYTGDVLRSNVAGVVEVIAETLKKPKYSPWDIEDQKKIIGYELEDFQHNAQSIVTESLHAAAYGDGSALGRSTFIPARNLDKITAATMKSFTKKYFTPSRMVLAAAGIEHEKLVELARKYFSDLPSSGSDASVAAPSSKYVGGDIRVRGDSHLTHLVLGFDAGKGWKSEDVLSYSVAQTLLGGGSALSSGAPGKGMSSRLFTRVLSKQAWVESVTAFNSTFSESGLFGIYGTSKAEDAGKLADVITAELVELSKGGVSEEEVSRAKAQLKTSIVMSLESRRALVEDIGRQVLTHGKRESVSAVLASIDKVSAGDVQKAIAKAISTPLTVAAFGDVSAIPTRDVLAAKLKN